MELNLSFPDDMEVSSCQLQRFVESLIDPKCSLKIEATSFCFDKNLSFLGNIIFSYMLFFFSEVHFTCSPKWFGITINTKFLKVLIGLFT